MPIQQNKMGSCQVSQAQQLPAANVKCIKFSVPPTTAELDALVLATRDAFPSALAQWALFADQAALACKQNSTPPALTQEPHGL